MLVSISGTDILYHLTNATKTVSILQRNRFELKPSEGTEAEQQMSSGSYYLSTTRSKLGSYTVSGLMSSSVIIVLDGRKLGQRYQVKPVDYWETNNRTGDNKMLMRSQRYESEDRVLSKEPFMKALPYIKELHVGSENSKREVLFALKKLALLKKIPIWFYSDTKQLLLMNKAKAVQVKFDKAPVTPVREPSEYMYKYKIRKNSLMGWLKLWMHPVKPGDDSNYEQARALGEDAFNKYKNLRYQDAINVLNADMHNEKFTPYEDVTKGRETLDKLVGIMRNLKADPKTFIERLREKWYPK